MEFFTGKKKKAFTLIVIIVVALIALSFGLQHIKAFANVFSWCADVVMPLIVGCGIALIINVPMGFLEKHLFKKSKNNSLCNLRRPVAFVLALIFIIGLLIGNVAIILPSLIDAVTVIVQLGINWVNQLNSMSKEEIAELPLGQLLLDVDWNSLISSAKNWLVDQAHIITNTVFGTVTSLVGIMTDLFVSVVFAAYILLTKEKIKKGIKHFANVWLPKNVGEFCYHAASIANANFKSFIFGQFFESVITGVLCFIGMLIFRFPYAAMTSVLVGVTAFVPLVGGLIGGIIGALIILTVDPIKSIWFVLYLLLLQQFEGNVIYPKLMGSRMNLPGMWVLASVSIGGGIGGPIGMLLAVPIASTIYVLFNEATEKRELKMKKSDDNC